MTKQNPGLVAITVLTFALIVSASVTEGGGADTKLSDVEQIYGSSQTWQGREDADRAKAKVKDYVEHADQPKGAIDQIMVQIARNPNIRPAARYEALMGILHSKPVVSDPSARGYFAKHLRRFIREKKNRPIVFWALQVLAALDDHYKYNAPREAERRLYMRLLEDDEAIPSARASAAIYLSRIRELEPKLIRISRDLLKDYQRRDPEANELYFQKAQNILQATLEDLEFSFRDAKELDRLKELFMKEDIWSDGNNRKQAELQKRLSSLLGKQKDKWKAAERVLYEVAWNPSVPMNARYTVLQTVRNAFTHFTLYGHRLLRFVLANKKDGVYIWPAIEILVEAWPEGRSRLFRQGGEEILLDLLDDERASPLLRASAAYCLRDSKGATVRKEARSAARALLNKYHDRKKDFAFPELTIERLKAAAGEGWKPPAADVSAPVSYGHPETKGVGEGEHEKRRSTEVPTDKTDARTRGDSSAGTWFAVGGVCLIVLLIVLVMIVFNKSQRK